MRCWWEFIFLFNTIQQTIVRHCMTWNICFVNEIWICIIHTNDLHVYFSRYWITCYLNQSKSTYSIVLKSVEIVFARIRVSSAVYSGVHKTTFSTFFPRSFFYYASIASVIFLNVRKNCSDALIFAVLEKYSLKICCFPFHSR